MRWYEGCIYLFAESLGGFNRLKNETNYIVRFLGFLLQLVTLMKTLLVPERPTTIVFEPLEAPSAGFGLGGLQRLKNSLMLAFLEPVVFSQRVTHCKKNLRM